VIALRFVKNPPRNGNEKETAGDQDVADCIDGISLAEERVP